MSGRARWSKPLALVGCLFLVYALLGNYFVLPGFRRFLNGGASEASTGAVVWGATKTILWMLSFQIGVVCLAYAAVIRLALPTRYLSVGLVFWFAFWGVPKLPQPGGWFYAGFGSLLLLAIAASLLGARPGAAAAHRGASVMRVAAYLFFALATWEICGLGAAGRILHPAESSQAFAHNLVVTQSSKLMLELVIAWLLLAASSLLRRPG